MEITKSDLLTTIRYLSDAAKVYAIMPKPKDQDRARQMRNLVRKLKVKNKV